MKKTLLVLSVFSLLVSTGCNMEPASYKEEISKMEDTLWKAFPSVNRLSIEVKNDFGAEIEVTMGDAELYNATEERRKDVTQKTALITKHIFAADKKPGKGRVIFVKEETTIDTDKDSWKTYEMPEEALK